MDVAYGTGQLRDFAADVASLLEKHVTSGPELAKLTDILLTGNCDAKVTSVETPTLQKVVEKLVKMAGPSAPSVAVTPAPKIKAG